MKKQLFICIISLAILKNAKSQDGPLNIGDYVEGLPIAKTFAGFNNGSQPKILVIYFWGVTCGTCVVNMPKVSQLQKDFHDDIQIVYATTDTKSIVEAFFSKRKDLRDNEISYVTDAAALKRIFPYRAVPHIVWIGKDRKVKAITASSYLNKDNIANLIKSNTISLPTKTDISVDPREPLIISSDQAREQLLYSSSLTTYVDGIGAKSGTLTLENGKTKIFSYNCPILQLYRIAYKYEIDLLQGLETRVVLEVKDKSKFSIADSSPESFQRSAYCYELVLPNPDDRKLPFRLMKADLDRYFGVKSKVEERSMKCYIISPNILANKADSSDIIENKEFIDLINQPLSKLITEINTYYKPGFPIVSAINEAQRVTVRIRKNLQNFDELMSDLAKRNINFSVGERVMKVLVITDENKNESTGR